jgi:hypothetical protein
VSDDEPTPLGKPPQAKRLDTPTGLKPLFRDEPEVPVEVAQPERAPEPPRRIVVELVGLEVPIWALAVAIIALAFVLGTCRG